MTQDAAGSQTETVTSVPGPHPSPETRTAEDATSSAPAIRVVSPAADATIDPRTGEPRRPWSVKGSTALLYTGVGIVFAGLLWVFWNSIDGFVDAAWLHGVTPTEPGSLVRVAMVAGEFAVALAIGFTGLTTGYYAWWGYRWTRWAGLVAVAVSAGALVLNPLAAWGIAPVALGAAGLWLPPTRAFFSRWHLRRHPEPPTPAIVDDVFYGPLPRYR